MTENTILEDIQYFIDEVISPVVAEHDGFVEIKSFTNGILEIELSGTCSHCSMQKITLEHGIKGYLLEEFPDHVKDVILAPFNPIKELVRLTEEMGLYNVEAT